MWFKEVQAISNEGEIKDAYDKANGRNKVELRVGGARIGGRESRFCKSYSQFGGSSP